MFQVCDTYCPQYLEWHLITRQRYATAGTEAGFRQLLQTHAATAVCMSIIILVSAFKLEIESKQPSIDKRYHHQLLPTIAYLLSI